MTKISKNSGGDMLSFNMAVDYTAKIAQYLHEAESAWERGDFRRSTWCCKKVHHKLTPFISDEEDLKIEKKLIYIQKLLLNLHNKKIRSHCSFRIERILRYLGRQLNKVGLLIPTSDDPRFLFR
jgi:hypothetical protein